MSIIHIVTGCSLCLFMLPFVSKDFQPYNILDKFFITLLESASIQVVPAWVRTYISKVPHTLVQAGPILRVVVVYCLRR